MTHGQDAALQTVEEFADKPGVVGFMITSVRHKPVHHNQYIKVYRAIEELGETVLDGCEAPKWTWPAR